MPVTMKLPNYETNDSIDLYGNEDRENMLFNHHCIRTYVNYCMVMSILTEAMGSQRVLDTRVFDDRALTDRALGDLGVQVCMLKVS